MYAIIRTGGKQYRVSEGDKVHVDKLAGEAGDSISFDDGPNITRNTSMKTRNY